MTKEQMPPQYDFKATEQRIYQWWEQNGWFKPEIADPDAEHRGDLKGELQGGPILCRFDCVDRLPRAARPARQLPLRHLTAFEAQPANSIPDDIFHRAFPR